MTALSFFKEVGVAKLGNIGDSLISWYAQHDPETASAADIAELGQRAEALAHRIAEIQVKLDHDQNAVMELTEKLDRDQKAAVIIGNRLKAAQDANNQLVVTQLTGQITPILNEIEQIAGDDGSSNTSGRLFDAKQTLAVDTADLNQFREAHTAAINDWTGARERLARARSAMEHAEQQKHDAELRQQQAERDAGLLHRAAAGQTALSAMEKRAEQMRTDARAAAIQAEGLRHVGGSDVASIVNEALAGDQSNKTDSALGRLARLTGGKA